MTRRRRSRVLMAAGLAVLCAVLGWLDLYLYTGSNGPVEPVLATERARVEVAPLPPEPRFAMAPIDDFAEIIERPIFARARRPPETAPPTAEAEPVAASLDFVLEGIVITSGQRLALFRPAAGGALVRVPEGETVLGWAVVAVEPYSVTVRRGEEETVLELAFETPSPVPPKRKSKRRRKRSKSADSSKPPEPKAATATVVPSPTATAVPVARPVAIPPKPR